MSDSIRAAAGLHLPRARERLLTAAVILLAAGSFWLATRHMSHSIWYDESQTVLVAGKGTLADVASAALTSRPYPPLFFWFVHESMKQRADETGFRMPSALFGALAVIAVFLLGKEIVGAGGGALAALLFVTTPGVFRYFVDGNPYTLLMLASALSTAWLIRAVRSGRWADWLLYGLFALLGLGTHSLFVFHVGAQAVAGLYLARSEPSADKPAYARLFTVMSLLLVAAAAWVLFGLRYGGDTRPILLSRLPEASTVVTVAGMYAGPLSFGSGAQLALWAALQLAGGTWLFFQRRRLAWFAATFAVVTLAAVTLFVKATLPYVAYRYALGVFPLACVVAAYAARFPAAARWSRIVRLCGVAAAVAYSAAGTVFIATAGPEAFEYQDWRSVAQFLDRSATAGDAVMLSYHYSLPPLTYYYRGPAKMIDLDASGRREEQAANLLAEPALRGKKVWVVIQSFDNESPLIARYTEIRRRGLDAQTRETIAAIRGMGLEAERVAAFHRVNVIAVTAPRPTAEASR